MAVANTKSTLITALDATPRTREHDNRIHRGVLMESVATVETAAADDDGSVYRMVRVPWNARISTIEVASDAVTAGTAFDIGVYQTAGNGGAAVDDDVFASALDLSSASAFTDRTYEATATNISKVEQELWQLLGLTEADVIGRDYDICLTGDTVGSAAVTISLRVRWVC